MYVYTEYKCDCMNLCLLGQPLPHRTFQAQYQQTETLARNTMFKNPNWEETDQLATYKVQSRS